jgi:hypothetical protein
MGGFASIANPWMLVYQPTAGDSFNLQGNGLAKTSDGVKAMGVDSTPATATITFDAPISSFSAYWGATDGFFGSDNITVNFSDGSSETFDYDPIPTGSGNLEWRGWSSTTGLTSVTYSGNFIAIDGIQATPVPEPAALAILTTGAVVSLRRRRQ